jgi:undecaprenyl-phosphate galactose phosphotransferase/putative colanic acid biosynthesis UDP-glucose lipid carrier transferase
MMTLVGFLFLLKSTASHSRGALVSFAVLGLAVLLGWRAILALRLRDALAKGQMTGYRVILIGDELARYSSAGLLQDYGAREIGRFGLSPFISGSKELSPRDSEIIEDAIRAARAHQPSKVLLAMNWSDERRREQVCGRLRVLPIPILLLPDQSTETLLAQPVLHMGTAAAVELQRAPLSLVELAIKRGFDLILTVLAIIVLPPVLITVAMAIKLETAGPVIFRQHRRGFNGRIFTIYKFRTMTVLEDGPVLRQAERNDRRITRVGAVLRRTSIDELPQLFNVLRGEMSVVGPRPHAIAHDDQYSTCISDYAFRNHVKPGLTGLAQIKGLRGETAKVELMERRVDHDVWYVNHWSLWLDLWIVAWTFFAVVTTKNAY